jgi:uncharacterized membrane protein YeaQ/YmgE (transglycosylase-associated protein family)
MNLMLGFAGALLGSFLATRVLNDEGLNPAPIAIATAGALLLLVAAQAFTQSGGSF